MLIKDLRSSSLIITSRKATSCRFIIKIW